MAKVSSTSSSRVPKAALLAVIAVLASEVAFLAKSDPLCGVPFLEPKVDDAALIVKRELIMKSEGAIVLAGDSSCLTGLRSKELGTVLGSPAVNLGTLSSHTTHGYADYAEEALAKNPKLLVIALLPQSIELNEWRTRFFGLYSRHLIASGHRNPDFPISLRERWDWLAHRHEFNVFPPEFGGSFARYRQDLLAENGWYPEKKQYDQPDFVRDEFVPTDLSVSGFERMVKSANDRCIPVVLYWSPHPTGAFSKKYQDAVRDWTKQIHLKWPLLAVTRDTLPGWPNDRFGSVTHLKPAAASLNTKELAESIRPYIK